MRFKEYLLREMPLILSFIGCMGIVNLIFNVSMTGRASFNDLIYMDVLCSLLFASSVGWHYYKISMAYKKVKESMEKNIKLEQVLSRWQDLPEISFIEKSINYEKEKFAKEEANYRESLNNMMDYTTQIVHDIKVNLAVCEMIAKRLPYEEREKLNYEIEQMKFRVTQMLYVARANHYNEDIKAEYFQMHEVLKKAIKENAEFFMNKNIELDVQIEPYEVLNDQKWVMYILSQILNNGSKYTGEGGKIAIQSKEDEKAYYLFIKDNGIGIAEEELGRIFDKGYTGTNGRLNTKATGMGLYYAKRMANILNIGLQVKSQKGEFTEFMLAFYKHSDYIKIKEYQES